MALPRNTLERPTVKAKVLSLILEGRSDEQVALALTTAKRSVTRQAITAFRHRHADELAPMQAAVVEAVRALSIAEKSDRIAAYDERWRLMKQIIEERGASMADEIAGGATGLMVKTYKIIGGGENAREVEEFKVDTALLAELRATELQAARELGQLPELEKRYGETNILNAAGGIIVMRGGPEIGV